MNRTNWLDTLLNAGFVSMIDICTMVPAAFIGVGLMWNNGKDVMTYVALGLPFLAIAFTLRAWRNKTG